MPAPPEQQRHTSDTTHSASHSAHLKGDCRWLVRIPLRGVIARRSLSANMLRSSP
jgi:hypothetical protein